MDATVAYLSLGGGCAYCAAKTHLLSEQCSTQSFRALEDIVVIKGPFRGGDFIFRSNQPSRSLYIVRHGAVKCERVSANGGTHVAGFYLAGELFGCEDIGVSHHSYDAVALEDSQVCEIPLDRLEKLFTHHPDLQHDFLARIGERIRSSERMLTDSFHLRAKDRLLNFLCDFYARLSHRGGQRHGEIILPMNKVDIANHLGISPETLSRLLRGLEEEGTLRNGTRQIELVDPERFGFKCKI